MRRIEPDDYFFWLASLIDDEDMVYDYRILLLELYSTRFIWTVENDDNRVADGLELRKKYMHEVGYEGDPNEVGPAFCSVLEVLISLAIRMEDILFDPDYGCQIHTWFWKMIENLDLNWMNDYAFLPQEFDEKMDIFLKRRYEKNGVGSIFYTKRSDLNFKKVELWYQMMYFIDENYS